MTEHHDIIARTEEFVFDLFKHTLPDYLVYHTYAHSESVTKTARKLAQDTELGEEGVEVVMLASLLHDTGYTELYKGHEEISVRIAAEYLRSQAYAQEKIEVVLGCIRATRIPQSPRNILEEIVADADLASLGKKSFFEQSELLRIEWERAQGRHYTDEEWLEQNIDLLSKHTFFTRAAQERYAPRQAENLRRLYKQKTESAQPTVSESVPESVASIPSVTPLQSPDLSLLMLMTDKSVRLIELANRRAQFFLVANIVLLLVLANDALRVGHTSIFGKPYILFAPCFLLSLFASIRSLSYRVADHSGQLTAERLHTELDELGHSAERKEATNQWVTLWFVLGIVVGIITHLLVWFYPQTMRY